MTVRRLREAGRHDAARALGDAFAADPVVCWIGGFDEAPRRATFLMAAAIDGRFRRGDPLIYTTERHEGVAIWDPPDSPTPRPSELLRAAIPIVRGARTGVGRLRRLFDVTESHRPDVPHYYLFVIGVHRVAQGGGLGSALLQSMLQRCDTDGVAAYLENSNPRNEPFYARHGFVPHDAIDVPDGCPPITGMWRAPR